MVKPKQETRVAQKSREVVRQCLVCVIGLQEGKEHLADEKEAHQVTCGAHLAAKQHAISLQTDIKAVQQELADQMHSCTTATEQATTLQTELITLEHTICSLKGQLGTALQDLAIEQQRHRNIEQANEGLQVQLQGMQQELIAAQEARENATAEKAAAEQSASSLHSRQETTQQLLICLQLLIFRVKRKRDKGLLR